MQNGKSFDIYSKQFSRFYERLKPSLQIKYCIYKFFKEASSLFKLTKPP